MELWALNPGEVARRMADAGELAVFYRAFAVTESSGLPLNQALAVLDESAAPSVRARIAALRASVERGGGLADGARGRPFLAFEEALLRLGEEAGSLDASLGALSKFFDADARLTRKIKMAMVRPLITIIAGCFILPLPLAFSVSIQAWLAVALPMLAVALASAGVVTWTTFTFIRGQPRYAVARLLWALAVATEAGLPIQRAVQLAASALGPGPTSRALLAVPPARWQGRPLSETLPEVCRLPRPVTAMLQTMERTGDTRSTLRWLAQQLEDGTLSAG